MVVIEALLGFHGLNLQYTSNEMISEALIQVLVLTNPLSPDHCHIIQHTITSTHIVTEHITPVSSGEDKTSKYKNTVL